MGGERVVEMESRETSRHDRFERERVGSRAASRGRVVGWSQKWTWRWEQKSLESKL